MNSNWQSPNNHKPWNFLRREQKLFHSGDTWWLQQNSFFSWKFHIHVKVLEFSPRQQCRILHTCNSVTCLPHTSNLALHMYIIACVLVSVLYYDGPKCSLNTNNPCKRCIFSWNPKTMHFCTQKIGQTQEETGQLAGMPLSSSQPLFAFHSSRPVLQYRHKCVF